MGLNPNPPPPTPRPTLTLDLAAFWKPLWRGVVTAWIQDDIFALQCLELVAEALAGRFKLDLLQKDLLGRGGQQLVEVAFIIGVLAARLQGLFKFIHYGHGASLSTDTHEHTLMLTNTKIKQFQTDYRIYIYIYISHYNFINVINAFFSHHHN